MNDFLEASDGWVPFLIFLITAVLLFALVLRWWRPLGRAIGAKIRQVEEGSSFEMGGMKVGEKLVTSTSDARADAKASGEDVKVWGNPDQMQLLFKAQGPGWRKSTKAMEVSGGCLVQVTSELQGAQGAWTSSEALEFVPGVTIADDPTSAGGRRLVARS